MDRLKGKRALITGAGAGIGRAAALAFVGEGAQVVALDRDAAALSDLPVAETIRLDVTDADGLDRLAFEPVDILVNAAGVVRSGDALTASEADWADSMTLNVTAAWRLTRKVLPGMIARGGGSIVNVASVASSLKGVPDRCAYSVSKAALLGLTRSVAVDFMAKGVRCNAVCPGTVDTPSLRARLAATGDAEAALKAFTARQPMGRLGAPEEVAALIVHLAGAESAFTTGQFYVIDGGWLA